MILNSNNSGSTPKLACWARKGTILGERDKDGRISLAHVDKHLAIPYPQPDAYSKEEQNVTGTIS